MKIYTRTGDRGVTSTLSGQRIPKDDCLIKVNGELDELQTQIDKVISYMKRSVSFAETLVQLERIRTLLWQLGGEISFGERNNLVKQPIMKYDVKDLENWIDNFNLEIKGFQRFYNPIAIEINEARVRTRRLERTLTKYLRKRILRIEVYMYLNRLSDYFFTLAVAIENITK